MEQKDVQSAVEKVVADVLENMYFIFPERLESEASESLFPEPPYKATVGVKNGSAVFAFFASEPLLRTMAKNLLGVDQVTQESDLADVFRETANMIAGNLVTELAFDANVSLEIPVVERAKSAQLEKSTSVSCFTLDDEPFKVAVLLRNG